MNLWFYEVIWRNYAANFDDIGKIMHHCFCIAFETLARSGTSNQADMLLLLIFYGQSHRIRRFYERISISLEHLEKRWSYFEKFHVVAFTYSSSMLLHFSSLFFIELKNWFLCSSLLENLVLLQWKPDWHYQPSDGSEGFRSVRLPKLLIIHKRPPFWTTNIRNTTEITFLCVFNVYSNSNSEYLALPLQFRVRKQKLTVSISSYWDDFG